MRIFIPFNTPSLKNAKVATSKGVFPSKTVRKYLQSLGVKSYSAARHEVENYKTRPNLFAALVNDMAIGLSTLKPPHRIGLHFIRDTRRKFDWINAAQIIFDLLTAHGVIEDDDMDHLIPYVLEIDGNAYGYDKHRPGCIVEYGGTQ